MTCVCVFVCMRERERMCVHICTCIYVCFDLALYLQKNKKNLQKLLAVSSALKKSH